MNEVQENSGTAYQAFNQRQRFWQGTLNMLGGIFRRLFALQIGAIAVLVFGVVGKFWDYGWPVEILTTLLPWTFIIYLSYPILVWRYRRMARRSFARRTRRGTSVVAPQELVQRLPEKGRIELCDGIMVPIPWETQHLICTGVTGVGKTVLLRKILQPIKHLKGLLHDGKSGELLGQFYNPSRDMIFNPLDKRSIAIDIFSILEEEAHFDSLARSMVPADATRENFFNNAAQQLLAAILKFCFYEGRTNAAVYRMLNLPMPELYARLRTIDAEAAGYIDSPTPMSQSVMATLRQCAGPCFRLLQNPENKPWFPLAEWFADPDKHGYIFLNTTARQREALLRVMAVFIDILCQLNLSLEDDPNRRFFYLIDEWSALPPMASMGRLIHEGRSKGAAMFLFFQNVAQAISTYGESTAQSFIDAASTYVIFRGNDSKTAEYWSRNLGQSESSFTEASLSAGYRQHDSESYRDVRHIETAVLPSEIQNLEKLHCFIKMQNLPVTLGSLKYQHYPRKHPGFVASDFYKLRAGERPDAAVEMKQHPKADEPPKTPQPSTPGKAKEFGIDNFDF